MNKPHIGSIVHYVAPGSADGTYPPAHRAAIVTEFAASDSEAAGEWRVNLMVCNPTGVHFAQGVPYHAAGDRPYSWHWIERIGQTDAR